MTQITETLLQSWSPESAWWFGALLGDGHVPRPSSTGYGRVTLVGARSTVSRWQALVTPDDAPLYEFAHSPGTFRSDIGSSVLLHQLAAKGLSGPKTFNLPWPSDIPDAVLPHFIRGLWDTDGCLSIIDRSKHGRRGNPQPQAIYVSVCQPFVEKLAAEIHRVSGLPLHNVTTVQRPTAPIHRVAYVGVQAHTFADWLYGAAPERLRNEDRMEVYAKFLELRAKRCACGGVIYSKDQCRTCWDAAIPNTTGEGTQCSRGCGRPVLAKGLCNACRKRDARALAKAAKLSA